MPDDDAGSRHVDDPGDDPPGTNYLTYYASEEDREWWHREFPDFEFPPRKVPLHDRDDDLPRAEDDPQCAEARGWLQARRNSSALATNRFGGTAAALKFVDQLYAEGASCVIVDHIMMLPQDDSENVIDHGRGSVRLWWD